MSAAVPRPYAGRFAPSPTGPLHFGSLVAAVASYADARSHAGRWLLRIEDIDPPREQPGVAASFPRVLERYGFAWDGPVLHQSTRNAAYRAALEQLRGEDKVFPCACSRAQLEKAPMGAASERVYPGTCRAGRPAGRAARSWRLRTDGVAVDFVDRVQGPQHQDLLCDVGDFVVRRADGLWAYQLAVVVDDRDQGVTDVVRGADLLSSTPRQIFLQRQLGAPLPRYAHVPVVVNAAGEKLSKQTRAAPLPMDDPQAVLRAAWRFLGQEEPMEDFTTPAEFWAWAIPRWDIRRVQCGTAWRAEPGVALGL
ncbi:MAG: tRNA glutamyl-Q(34) synthetase GluQRS [Betaproteobacteria bacterium]|nr:tRNA glutamyl-Q(34) synthetase GluQRS [Betaproteobacteria bacterium]